jgi:hypothetical protein
VTAVNAAISGSVFADPDACFVLWMAFALRLKCIVDRNAMTLETAELAACDSCSCRTDAPHAVENPDPSAEALIYLIVERR